VPAVVYRWRAVFGPAGSAGEQAFVADAAAGSACDASSGNDVITRVVMRR